MEFLAWLEGSGVGTWVRESLSLWAYPSIIALHALGLALLVGINTAIDLRILGFAPRLPLAPLQKFFPVMWFGFSVNALSGILLTVANATRVLTSPVFYVKLLFISLAVVNIPVVLYVGDFCSHHPCERALRFGERARVQSHREILVHGHLHRPFGANRRAGTKRKARWRT